MEKRKKKEQRKHKADDVCELGAMRSLVFRDMSGSTKKYSIKA